ncbi:hypothetical protein [Leifsonia sp. NPDC058248]|uniref:hypothetical protein n=1 Tax=Leifsonia sp. NPDC058248 TaxID=3346402 RepID=UPI0036D912FE
MPAVLRLPTRAIVVVTSLLLVGGAAGFGAAPASAIPTLPSPGAAALSPGLYVKVIDGAISLSNSSGFAGFSAGQFGYMPSTLTPPVVVPRSPALSFSPPPVFQSPATQSAAQKAAQPAADASAHATALASAASTAKADADAQAQSAQAAAAHVTTAGVQKEAAWAANLLAQQKAADAQRALADAQAAVEAAAETDQEAAAVEAARVATAALAAAAEAAEAAAQQLAEASLATDAAHAAEAIAAQLAETAKTQADQAAQAAADAARTAGVLLAGIVPAIPARLPAPTVPSFGAPPLIPAGQHLILAGAGFAPSTQVAFGVYSTPLSVVPVTVDAQGFAVASFQVPSTFTGNHSLVAVGTGVNGLQRILRIDIVVQAPVVAAPAADDAATLADTGADLVIPLSAAMVALLFGTVLLTLVRRRRAA